jgi:hypothetical protein
MLLLLLFLGSSFSSTQLVFVLSPFLSL